jgi:hypothetical protein
MKKMNGDIIVLLSLTLLWKLSMIDCLFENN